MATLNALRLEAFTADPRWRLVAEQALRSYRKTLEEQPLAVGELLLALDTATDLPREVVLVWPPGGLARAVPGGAAPDLPAEPGALRRRGGGGAGAAGGGGPHGRRQAGVEGRPTAYVCQRGACQLPATGPEQLAAQLAPARAYGA